jgi:hypothetical protein
MAGMRLPCTALGGLEGFSALANSVPHTRQRVASALNRVPQVGHRIVFVGVFSRVIGICWGFHPGLKDYTRNEIDDFDFRFMIWDL